MSALPVDISTSATARFAMVVDELDFALHLVEDLGQGQTPIFDATRGQPGLRCPLLADARYVLQYNNNDGNVGLLHFRIVEQGAQEVDRREVRLGPFSAPTVLEFEITLRRNPALAPA